MTTSTQAVPVALDLSVWLCSIAGAGVMLMSALSRLGEWAHGIVPDTNPVWAFLPLVAAVMSIGAGAFQMKSRRSRSLPTSWLNLLLCVAILGTGVVWFAGSLV
ncbi:MAG: hypothetical protein WAS54_08330 [Scrofimicrobium sp.]